jgi:hypothetical protein
MLSLSAALTKDVLIVRMAAAHQALSGMPPFYYVHDVLHTSNTKDLILAIPKLEPVVAIPKLEDAPSPRWRPRAT